MFEFLRRLLGGSVRSATSAAIQVPAAEPVRRMPEKQQDRPKVADPSRPKDKALSGRAAVDEYFKLSGVIESAKARGDYQKAVRASRNSFPLMPAVVAQMKKEFGAFDIATSHAIHTGGTLMAVMEDAEGISELRQTLDKTVDLHKWLESADQAESDLRLVKAVLAVVTANPGVKQNELKRFVDGDGRRLSTLVSWLDKGGRLHRVSRPPTYALFIDPPPRDNQPQQSTCQISTSLHVPTTRKRSARSASHAAKLELNKLPYVRLPKAPPSWEEKAQPTYLAGRALISSDDENGQAIQQRFAVSSTGWRVMEEQKLTPGERPNPAYRMMFPTGGSTVWLDRKGTREDFPEARSIVMTTGRDGRKIAEQALPFDVYRSDVNSDGSGMVFMSSDGLLHAYSDTLETMFVDQVSSLPEYEAQAKRFGISETQLKNHTRCVALSADRTRFLVTIVDEAWCYDVETGKPIWGLRFPSKEGWSEVATERSGRSGVSSEIYAALDLMELKLPVSPEEVTRQYKTLAKQWHPDKNQQLPEFTRKFQDLNAAMEMLTGMDLSRLSRSEIETSSYEQMLHRVTVPLNNGQSLTFTISLQVGGSFGTDWIYAANFAYEGCGSFLAGYSGRVVKVDPSGRPVRVYDVGTVPTQITETPSHLYILTPTRLYILQGDRLLALVDVFDQGRIVVTHNGFGLLQSKSFRWFSPDGRELGNVVTKDPIRRVFYGSHGLCVETRTHRAVIQGLQPWW
jgi:hypothetical protein